MSILRRGPRFSARLIGLSLTAVLAMPLAASAAGGGGSDTPHQKWTFGGFFGHYDQAQLQRGFQVYKEVCAACHNLRLVKYRNLGDVGGPQFSEAVVKELAKASEFTEIDDSGKVKKRVGRPSDPILLAPYKNEQEARATYNGALPPDLSVIAKARGAQATLPWYKEPVKWLTDIVTGYQEGGPDYIHALLMGYGDPPKDLKNEDGTPFKLADGMNFNKNFPGYQIAMAKPAIDDKLIKYDFKPDAKGNAAPTVPLTQDQYARDVTAFLMWTAEPKLDQRKRMGWQVLLYLAITSLLLWLAKRRLWAKIPH